MRIDSHTAESSRTNSGNMDILALSLIKDDYDFDDDHHCRYERHNKNNKG